MLKSSTVKFKKALKKAEHAGDLIRQLAEGGDDTPEGIALDKKICALVRPGYYEHFKSSPNDRKYYFVFEALSHVNYKLFSHKYQVRYMSLYGKRKGRKALRELLGNDGFLTPKQQDGYIGPRFVYVGKKLPRTRKKRNSA